MKERVAPRPPAKPEDSARDGPSERERLWIFRLRTAHSAWKTSGYLAMK